MMLLFGLLCEIERTTSNKIKREKKVKEKRKKEKDEIVREID